MNLRARGGKAVTVLDALRQRAATPEAAVGGGVLLVACGFGVLVFTWAKVAGLLVTSLQLPYVISGGGAGLLLVQVGLLLLRSGPRRRRAAERAARHEELTALLRRLGDTGAQPAEAPAVQPSNGTAPAQPSRRRRLSTETA
ncbi:MAG TPA: hypothetical protein VM938_15565 [Acidimicrobiales bacterium]|nr:hypothetical protein [Acidimicrobiales bacterium]